MILFEMGGASSRSQKKKGKGGTPDVRVTNSATRAAGRMMGFFRGPYERCCSITLKKGNL